MLFSIGQLVDALGVCKAVLGDSFDDAALHMLESAKCWANNHSCENLIDDSVLV